VVESPGSELPLALDPGGTRFQQRVWQAVRDVPAGSTATYSEIADRIGSPEAVRAVAHACGANPVAVAIPCHRIVRRNGSLAGYRWGIERKRELLRREALA
jgi:AraC family transcriptional regulator of adaptative response/methylated-DNA-[protein]-cysteine methyltransferase